MLISSLKTRSLSEKQLSPHLQNRRGGGSGISQIITLDSQIMSNVIDYEGTAGEALLFKDAVKLDANNKLVKTDGECIGFVLNDALLNEKVKIRIFGGLITTTNDFTSLLGQKVYLHNGAFKSFPTLTLTDKIQEVGYILNDTTFFINLNTCYTYL
jgi:hypothetical protein